MAEPTAVLVPLRALAHARSGDKGDTLNVGVVARRPELYPLLAAELTAERVAEAFRDRRPARVRRFELPGVGALNFVLDGVLDGGVNHSLSLDGHGKTLSFRLLELRVPVPRALLSHCVLDHPTEGGTP